MTKELRTLKIGDWEIPYRLLTIGDIVRYANTFDTFEFPRSYYLPAYDAFKLCAHGFGKVTNKIPAGVVLQVGLEILKQSGFVNPIEQIAFDYEQHKNSLLGYFDLVRTLSCTHFHYKFEESISWDYEKIMEMAARLELATGLDISPTAVLGQQANQMQQVPEQQGQFTIRKGQKIDPETIKKHNEEARAFKR